jgi:hypothetical protein
VRRTRAYLEATINPATGAYLLPKVTVKLFGEEDQGALVLGGYLREAYQEAEAFSLLLQQRVRGAGFFKTLLLRRLGSSMEAGRRTMSKLLGEEPDTPDDEDEDDAEEETPASGWPTATGRQRFQELHRAEMTSLRRCLELLKQGGNNDPKLEALIGYLRGTHPGVTRRWLDLGCILFSQYYDTVRWIGDELARRAEFSGHGNRALRRKQPLRRLARRQVPALRAGSTQGTCSAGELKLLLGTDAASEGLNLQRLGYADQYRPAVEPDAPGAAEGPYPAHWPGP